MLFLATIVGLTIMAKDTILKDNPQLTCRLKRKRVSHPARIVLDRENKIPLKAKVFANSKAQRVIYVSGPGLSAKREKILAEKKIEVIHGKTGKSGFDLKHLMELLLQKDLTSILMEGGSEINNSAFSSGIVDRVYAFICPVLIGGRSAPGPIGGLGVDKIAKALRLKNMKVVQLGEDLMVEAEPCSVE